MTQGMRRWNEIVRRASPGLQNGMSQAPRWAWAVMAVGVLAVVFVAYVFLNPPSPREVTVAGAGATDAESTTAASATTPAAEPGRVLVVGDRLSAGTGETGWPALVTGAAEAAGRTVVLDVAAADGAGYAREAADGSTFQTLVEGAGGDYDVVVFFGSQSDNAAATEVQAAATAAFRAAGAASPGVAQIAIGPPAADAAPPGYLVTNRDAIAAAAAAAGVTFVDPLAESWFAGADAALLGPDGRSLTEAGHQYVADRIGPRIELALASTP